ncbi:acyl carrier protein [Actinoplanes sp. NPDC023936]|uniref:acyl carrier protein n=1 Tax=Actinoplanes sp. NPDC023936 TaxID=3154910 RepID=UPI0033FE4C54
MTRTTDAFAAATVADVLAVDEATVCDAATLFDVPGYDSMAIVTVLERIEDHYGVEVPPRDVVPETFSSVPAISALIDRLRTDATPEVTAS